MSRIAATVVLRTKVVDMKQVYVRLLNEGTDVWRPVAATAQGDGTYLLSERTMSEDEQWEFPPGSRVTVEEMVFEGKPELVAVRLYRQSR
jgi:hypothetical protein